MFQISFRRELTLELGSWSLSHRLFLHPPQKCKVFKLKIRGRRAKGFHTEPPRTLWRGDSEVTGKSASKGGGILVLSSKNSKVLWLLKSESGPPGAEMINILLRFPHTPYLV